MHERFDLTMKWLGILIVAIVAGLAHGADIETLLKAADRNRVSVA